MAELIQTKEEFYINILYRIRKAVDFEGATDSHKLTEVNNILEEINI